MKFYNIALLYLCSSLLLLSSCAEYNEADFFEATNTNSYPRDAYTGYTDFAMESRFNIAPESVQEINFTAFDGNSSATIYGLFIGDVTTIPTRKIIVYFHDNPENLNRYWPRIKLLANLGLDEFHVLAIDYRGYGKSSGTPSESGIYADADGALRWLQDNGAIGENIILYGYGLGAAAAVELAVAPRSLRPDKIILEAPFASIESLIQNELLLSVPKDYFTNLSFNNADKITRMQQPLLWLHGRNDSIYDNESQGQVVFDSHPGQAGKTKFSIQVNGANHYNVPEKFSNRFDEYLARIANFLQQP